MKRIKDEELFRLFSDRIAAPNDIGRRQFIDHQSHGKRPDNPDPYYLLLDEGKSSFELESETLRKGFHGLPGGFWFGTWILLQDWDANPWVVRELLRWWPSHLRLPRGVE